ncbi:MAG TPA: hypothetical protein VMD05_07850 [Candidatus Nanoarchaeia archaeon]|nr:hypothetical protein [Candidatus Nanoarchaeia archaeon]
MKNMIRPAWRKCFVWFLKGNLVVWVINGVLFAVLGFSGSGWANLVAAGYFSKIAFLETGVAFLVGGAIAFSGSLLPNKAREQIFKTADEPWSMDKLRKGEKNANKYIGLALILFVESLIVALFGF